MSDDTKDENEVATRKNQADQPNLLEDFLRMMDERFQAALSQAESVVEQKRKELADAEAQLEKVRQYDPNRTMASSSTPHREGMARGGSGNRAPRGAVQQPILNKLAEHPEGLTRSGLLEALGAKGKKKEEDSISNALTNLRKAGKIRRNGVGSYVVA